MVTKPTLTAPVNKYDRKQSVSIDNGGGSWYLQACKFLKIKQHTIFIQHMGKKVTLKETIQYIKDRTECFVDDVFSVC